MNLVILFLSQNEVRPVYKAHASESESIRGAGSGCVDLNSMYNLPKKCKRLKDPDDNI